MGLFDDAFGESKPDKLNKEVAFLGILMLADYSDGTVSDDEMQGFVTAVSRMKMYRDLTGDQVNRLIDRGNKVIRQKGPEEALKLFAQALPEPLHRAVFANAVNQVLADGVVEDEEKEFIQNLRRALGLSGDDANMIAKVIMWKNQG
ncbi:tellurite resistance TerB family protein [Urbifossiella limnaea]|uniref:Tellurite resistance protein TerB n=1 Tax=Urbifossiella limnaea TaxID=2528023 RepID=A0A517XZY0_9BACT|nr:tellurite resistance TerB family protein [Urbifossiella limnaea]QDU23060.1 Tellurite resistance protein TerB [Urbifossiella limnaea]